MSWIWLLHYSYCTQMSLCTWLWLLPGFDNCQPHLSLCAHPVPSKWIFQHIVLNSVDNYLYIVYIVVVIVVHIHMYCIFEISLLPIVLFPLWCYSIVLHLILYHAQTWYGILTAVCDLCFVLSCLVFNVMLLLNWMEYE